MSDYFLMGMFGGKSLNDLGHLPDIDKLCIHKVLLYDIWAFSPGSCFTKHTH